LSREFGGSTEAAESTVHATSLIIALWASIVLSGAAFAQTNAPPRAPTDCPPDVKGDGPTVGRSQPSLSDKLAESKGIICPPAGVDPEMQKTPPAGGEIKVIPPPGAGGNQNVQPK
jgi:hypothetical protein